MILLNSFLLSQLAGHLIVLVLTFLIVIFCSFITWQLPQTVDWMGVRLLEAIGIFVGLCFWEEAYDHLR